MAWHRRSVARAASLLMFALSSAATAQTGQSQSPLVGASAPMSADDMRRLGLVTVDGRCSGVLLHPSWVLSAAHCVTGAEQLATPANVLITAAWPATAAPTAPLQAVPAAAIYSSWGHRTGPRTSTTYDLLLVRLSAPIDLGASFQLPALDVEEVHRLAGSTVRIYGRGITNWAQVNPTTQQTVSWAMGDGNYRWLDVILESAPRETTPLHPGGFTPLVPFPVTNASSVAGGDSGGPALRDVAGQQFIVGVSSLCRNLQCTPDQPNCAADPQRWRGRMGFRDGKGTCLIAPVEPLREAISDVMKQTWNPGQSTQRLQVTDTEASFEPDLYLREMRSLHWAKIARAAQKRCVSRGFYAGVVLGPDDAGGRLELLCLSLDAIEFSESPVGPAVQGPDAFDDPEAVGWAQAARSAATICARRGMPAGFHTGYRFTPGPDSLFAPTLATICLRSHAVVWKDQQVTGESRIANLETIEMAEAHQEASRYCEAIGYANGGFLNGHAAGDLRGTVCFSPHLYVEPMGSTAPTERPSQSQSPLVLPPDAPVPQQRPGGLVPPPGVQPMDSPVPMRRPGG